MTIDRHESEPETIAELLLRAQAVTLNVKQPYRYASGILSPIYCDNRLLLSFPELRRTVVRAFCEAVRAMTPQPQVVAGVATAGIAWAAWIAEVCEMPLIYVRASAKAHGKGNQIEGQPQAGLRAVVIEDLLSTGGSSVAAVAALRAAQIEVSDCLAIFSYQLPACRAAFEAADCRARALTTLDVLLESAGRLGLLSAAEIESVRVWNRDPQAWGNRDDTRTSP